MRKKRNYLYMPLNKQTTEFKGPINFVLALQEAEKRFGPGGRLFAEVVLTVVVEPDHRKGTPS